MYVQYVCSDLGSWLSGLMEGVRAGGSVQQWYDWGCLGCGLRTASGGSGGKRSRFKQFTGGRAEGAWVWPGCCVGASWA